MSINSFKSQAANDLFLGDNTDDARKALAQHAWTAAARRLALLDSATKLADLARVPGLRLMPLKNELKERGGVLFYSIRINDQYRIVFRWEDGAAYDVDVEAAKHHT